MLRCRRGAAALELAFLFPILFVASLGALELAMIIYDFHTASEATRRGVRTAIIDLLPGLPSVLNYPDFGTTRMGQSCTVGGTC